MKGGWLRRRPTVDAWRGIKFILLSCIHHSSFICHHFLPHPSFSSTRPAMPLLSLIPRGVVSYFGRLQFRHPGLGPPIRWMAARLTGHEGVIARGAGKGLRFDASGCNPGYLAGTSAPDEQQFLVDHLQPGDVFWDIGSNAGFFAVIGAQLVGESGRVYAFEPTPRMARRARRNAALNDFDQLEVIEAAVSDRDGTATFGMNAYSLTNSLKKARLKGAETIEVRTATLDSMVKSGEIRPPSCILMDIEGAEIEALAGGIETIRAYRPVLLIEVHWKADFPDFVREHLGGYTARLLNHQIDPAELIDRSSRALPAGKARYHAVLEGGRK